MKTWIGTLIPAVVASVVVVAAVGVAQDKTSVLKGTRDTSSASDPRASVGTANQAGIPITFLGADGEGSGALVLNDSTGQTRLSLNAGGSGGSLFTTNNSGTEVVAVSSSGDGGLLSIRAISGAEVALLGVDSDGGRLRLLSNNGTSVIFLGADTDGEGILWLNNQSGDSVATVGVDADGGFLRLQDHSDETVVLIAAESGGGGGFIAVSGARVHDVAEVFDLDTREDVVPGTVMSVDALGGGGLRPSATAYDRKVVGVISGAGDFRHAMLIGSREDGSYDLPVALSGQVYVRVSVENGPISPGDLLVSSSSGGVAMAATETERSFGAVLGKAMQAYAGEDPEGLIRMLVMVR